ncbi:MAG: hypothetical protein NC231_03360 [Bacillus sp. (in: Bacteria)]|nr:hypothetical protein [Bacillus sp. (in: firmicutes)]MCM1428134.1 hypothetical protein [Eubacterium sp.]
MFWRWKPEALWNHGLGVAVSAENKGHGKIVITACTEKRNTGFYDLRVVGKYFYHGLQGMGVGNSGGTTMIKVLFLDK